MAIPTVTKVTLLNLAVLTGIAPPVRPQTPPAAQAAHLQSIEATVVDIPVSGTEAPLRMSLQEVMALYKVPGLSLAIVDGYRITQAKAYGVTDAASGTPVTNKTLFQAGSISKPVAAAAALSLVEHGALALDEDVNVKLKSWKVPESEYTRTEKVTLRRLMSHSAGLTVHGFPGYDVEEPLPTLVQILDGEKPANTPPIRVDIVPGTKTRYSGGGVTVEQLLLMDVTGKPFPELMRETVLERIGMTDSSYAQPLPPTWAERTPTGTRADGTTVHGRWHIYPEMAAAGLWTTPTDLAKFAIEIAQSKRGETNHVLSTKMTSEMLTPVLDEAGLGFFLSKENPGEFGHGGADEGFQALLTMNWETGKGLAVMANSDRGIAVAELVQQAVAREYGWNRKQSGDGFSALLLLAKAKGASVALRRYTEMRKAGAKESGAEEGMLNQVGYMLLGDGQVQDAILVFERNAQEYPQSSNAYDSLGEAYMKAGQKDLAIVNYKKSLQLDPGNQNAVGLLKKLQAPD